MSRLERDELFLSRIFNRLSLSLRLDRSIMDSFESATSVSYSPSHITKGNSCAPLDFTSCPLWGNASMLEANASTSSISNKVNSSHSKKQKKNISESESSRISPITCRPGIGSFRMLFPSVSSCFLTDRVFCQNAVFTR